MQTTTTTFSIPKVMIVVDNLFMPSHIKTYNNDLLA
jgi:hypothetical protein